MADIQLVIKISEEHYNAVKNGQNEEPYIREFADAIVNGTLLPKDYGRLGDLDALEEEMLGGINAGLMIDGYEDYSHINDTEDCLECVKYADTIIKAHHPASVKEKPGKGREQINSANLAPADRQIRYAKYLAKRMCQDLPAEFTKQAYSDFISKWEPAVMAEDAGMNEPDAWQIQYM